MLCCLIVLCWLKCWCFQSPSPFLGESVSWDITHHLRCQRSGLLELSAFTLDQWWVGGVVPLNADMKHLRAQTPSSGELQPSTQPAPSLYNHKRKDNCVRRMLPPKLPAERFSQSASSKTSLVQLQSCMVPSDSAHHLVFFSLSGWNSDSIFAVILSQSHHQHVVVFPCCWRKSHWTMRVEAAATRKEKWNNESEKEVCFLVVAAIITPHISPPNKCVLKFISGPSTN